MGGGEKEVGFFLFFFFWLLLSLNCLNKLVNWWERDAVTTWAMGFMEHYPMVKAADILLAAPSAHSRIYLHLSPHLSLSLDLWSAELKKATWAPDPFTPRSQRLTVAFNLCKLIPSSIINTHMEYERRVVFSGLEEPWQHFSNTQHLRSLEAT